MIDFVLYLIGAGLFLIGFGFGAAWQQYLCNRRGHTLNGVFD